jgi:MFS superfamily sulfate permease-like transporter
MARPALPVQGWTGFKQFFAKDASAGFAVFLLALPLSLGIAEASDVPPLMGVVTAIVGGLVASFLTGSELSIKGPAAGLIVIVAGAVEAFGGGEIGWRYAAAAMLVAGLVQVLFALFKMGRLVDFFPLAVIHGILAAIGLIIIAKQLPVLLNVDPSVAAGLSPFALFAGIPDFLQAMDREVALLGAGAIAIMLFWPRIPKLSMIPAPIVVLLIAIPVSIWQRYDSKAAHTLVEVGSIVDAVGINLDFGALSLPGVFIKYVIMLAVVGSIESLLTIKSVDVNDPWRRESDPNRDLLGIGVGNTICAVLGAIPMISEVARSSANVNAGGVTRWANFWHGLFLLLFVLTAYPLLELIPNTVLAAMLIVVGWQLAHPRHFRDHWHIGRDQLLIFLVTIIVTLVTDLLVGVVGGIIVKLVLHRLKGATFRQMCRRQTDLRQQGDTYEVVLNGAAVFTNLLSIKKLLLKIPARKTVDIIAADDLKLIDHSVVDLLHNYISDYEDKGGVARLVDLDKMDAVSSHPSAARIRK